jgi:hypothetical protein
MAKAPSSVRQKATPKKVVSWSESSVNRKLEPQIKAMGMNNQIQCERTRTDYS